MTYSNNYAKETPKSNFTVTLKSKKLLANKLLQSNLQVEYSGAEDFPKTFTVTHL